MSSFYQQQDNFLNINILDSKEILIDNYVKLIITSTVKKNKNTYDLAQIGNIDKILIYSGDIITFQSRINKLQTLINIYLWDGTIIRMFPQTSIRVSKLLKNQNNLLESETTINLEKGNIWFNFGRTTVKDNGFNIQTSDFNLVIRGTAGLISSDNKFIYAQNHIIEVHDKQNQVTFISQGQVGQFINNQFNLSSRIQFSKNIENKLGEQITSIINLDKIDIHEYHQNILNYIKTNYNYDYAQFPQIDYLIETKLYLLSLYDKSYLVKLNNLYKYKYLFSQQVYYPQSMTDYIDNNAHDLIITPINQKFNDLKLKFLNEYSKSNPDSIKTYLINSYNKIIDAGDNITNFDFNNFSQEYSNANYFNKLKQTLETKLNF